MRLEIDKTRNSVRSAACWLGVLALSMLMSAVAPAPIVAEEQGTQESTSEHEGAAEEHGEEHFHKNHVAVFVGSTEAEEHHGEKADPDFTVGFDYERRFNKWFGAGAMLDFVVEGWREYLAGPLFILHAGKGAKLFAAPCYQSVREGGEDNFVFRSGFGWDFFFGKGKYSVFPSVYYDFAEGQDFLVLGVGFGMGF
jgi:hypothetical protein